MKTFTLLSAVTFIPAVLGALPDDIVAKPLPDGCASYPLYDPTTDIAGPWILEVSTNAENPAIRGFGNTGVYSIAYNPRTDPKPSLRWGYITIPTRYDIAKFPLRCASNRLEVRAPTDLTGAGEPTAVQWTPLTLSPYPYDASLLWNIPAEQPPKIFEHYLNGEKQEGVYLGGYDNTTLWGFQYNPANVGSSGLDYYYMRLLGPDSADPTTGQKLKANETRGYIRINA